MAKLNCRRAGCKDVFNAFLVEGAHFAGLFELPIIEPTVWIPNKLIAFSKAVSSNDYNQWVHFYEDDYLFERVWRNPKRYLPILKRFNGVILPDFSVYRDMPLVMQLWNIFRSRAVGYWLQENNVRIIANIRFGDERTHRYCCDGIASHCAIAVGTHGTIKDAEDRRVFSEGLAAVVEQLEPRVIIVYGCAPESIFGVYREKGIEIVVFESDCATSHKRSK